jgi:hypothetical protein
MLDRLSPEVLDLVREVFRRGGSFYVCGGSDADFAEVAAHLMRLSQSRLYSLALLSSEMAWDVPKVMVVKDDRLGGADFLRSASRQDPDCVIVDRRAEEAVPILLQLRFTGHQLVAHLSSVKALGPESAMLSLDVVLDLDSGPTVAQFQDGELRQLFRLLSTGESLQVGAALDPVPAPAPAPPEPVPLPPDWKPWEAPLVESLRSQLGPGADHAGDRASESNPRLAAATLEGRPY